MAKDAKGHGSEKRGVSGTQARNDRMFGMFERARAQGHNTFNATSDAAAQAKVLGKGGASDFAKTVGAGEQHIRKTSLRSTASRLRFGIAPLVAA